MKKRWYKIVGISETVLEEWQENMREDINLFKAKDGVLYMLVQLSFLQMLEWKYLIFKSNVFEEHYGFKLKRM